MNIRFDPVPILDVKGISYCSTCCKSSFNKATHGSHPCILPNISLLGSDNKGHIKVLTYKYHECFLKNCGFVCTSSYSLSLHLSQHGFDLEYEPSSVLKCSKCPYRTLYPVSLKKHEDHCEGGCNSTDSEESDSEPAPDVPTIKEEMVDVKQEPGSMMTMPYVRRSRVFRYKCENCDFDTSAQRYLKKHIADMCPGAGSARESSSAAGPSSTTPPPGPSPTEPVTKSEEPNPEDKSDSTKQPSEERSPPVLSPPRKRFKPDTQHGPPASPDDVVLDEENDGEDTVYPCNRCNQEFSSCEKYDAHSKACKKAFRDKFSSKKGPSMKPRLIVKRQEISGMADARKKTPEPTSHKVPELDSRKAPELAGPKAPERDKTPNNDPKEPTAADKFKCENCPFSSVDEIVVKCHQSKCSSRKKCGTKTYRHRCPGCHDVFYNGNGLNEHQSRCKAKADTSKNGESKDKSPNKSAVIAVTKSGLNSPSKSAVIAPNRSDLSTQQSSSSDRTKRPDPEAGKSSAAAPESASREDGPSDKSCLSEVESSSKSVSSGVDPFEQSAFSEDEAPVSSPRPEKENGRTTDELKCHHCPYTITRRSNRNRLTAHMKLCIAASEGSSDLSRCQKPDCYFISDTNIGMKLHMNSHGNSSSGNKRTREQRGFPGKEGNSSPYDTRTQEKKTEKMHSSLLTASHPANRQEPLPGKPPSMLTNQSNREVCPQCNFNGSYNLSASFTLGYYSRALKNHTKLCKRRQKNDMYSVSKMFLCPTPDCLYLADDWSCFRKHREKYHAKDGKPCLHNQDLRCLNCSFSCNRSSPQEMEEHLASCVSNSTQKTYTSPSFLSPSTNSPSSPLPTTTPPPSPLPSTPSLPSSPPPFSPPPSPPLPPPSLPWPSSSLHFSSQPFSSSSQPPPLPDITLSDFGITTNAPLCNPPPEQPHALGAANSGAARLTVKKEPLETYPSRSSYQTCQAPRVFPSIPRPIKQEYPVKTEDCCKSEPLCQEHQCKTEEHSFTRNSVKVEQGLPGEGSAGSGGQDRSEPGGLQVGGIIDLDLFENEDMTFCLDEQYFA